MPPPDLGGLAGCGCWGPLQEPGPDVADMRLLMICLDTKLTIIIMTQLGVLPNPHSR